MIVYCRAHGNVMGVVERHPTGGFPQLSSRSPRWRDRYAAQAQVTGRHNSWQRLDDRAVLTLPADGCRRCGSRELPIKDLLLLSGLGFRKSASDAPSCLHGVLASRCLGARRQVALEWASSSTGKVDAVGRVRISHPRTTLAPCISCCSCDARPERSAGDHRRRSRRLPGEVPSRG